MSIKFDMNHKSFDMSQMWLGRIDSSHNYVPCPQL